MSDDDEASRIIPLPQQHNHPTPGFNEPSLGDATPPSCFSSPQHQTEAIENAI